jgi:hypothetical protein
MAVADLDAIAVGAASWRSTIVAAAGNEPGAGRSSLTSNGDRSKSTGSRRPGQRVEWKAQTDR